MVVVCRLRNDVDDLPRELLKDKPGLQLFGRLMIAASQITFSCCRQAVSSADPPADRCIEAQPGADHCVLPVDDCACAGGGSCSKSFVDATIFASDQAPSTCRLPRCSGAAQERRSGFLGSASTRLTVLRAHHLVLICKQQPYSRASRHKLQRLRRAAPSCILSALLVSVALLSARAHAERTLTHIFANSFFAIGV